MRERIGRDRREKRGGKGKKKEGGGREGEEVKAREGGMGREGSCQASPQSPSFPSLDHLRQLLDFRDSLFTFEGAMMPRLQDPSPSR